MEKMLTVKCIF